MVDRIILNKLAKTVRLEETQYGSRKDRSTHDAMKQILEFLEYNKDKYTGILSMDVEGGFDKVNIDMLSDILVYRKCEPRLVEWIRRWTKGRRIQLRFNGKVSKEYNLNKGVPQGSPLSPFLFRVYVADMFRSRICCRLDLSRMVSSYVDDGVIVISTANKKKTKQNLIECFEDYKKIANDRGMDFSVKKLDWMGIGKGDWGTIEIDGNKLKMVKEIRILGYRIDTNRKWRGHVEYWRERGMGIRRNISGVGRRYGSEGGIGAWECWRLIQSVYLPTVCYGLEFVTGETKLLKEVQITINDTIRSILRAPIQYANMILYAETGIEPLEIRVRAEERKGYARHLKYEYGKDYPWFGCIAEKWKDNRIRKQKTNSEKVRKTTPIIDIERDKEKAIEKHAIGWENKPNDEVWIYTDGSKKGKEAAIAWVMMDGEELMEEERGMRVPGEWNITKIEICAMGMAMRDMAKLGKKKIRIFSNSMSGIIMIKEMRAEGDLAALWDVMTGILNEWEQVRITWIPGHKGIEGNKIADEVAKGMRNRNLERGGRWKEVDYEENSTNLIKG